MAHIEVDPPQQHETQKTKKKFKLTRKNIIIYGGVAIGLIVLLMMLTRGRRSSVQQEPIILPPAEDGLPTAGMPIGGIPNYQDDINKMQEQMALSNESMLNTMTEVFTKMQTGFDDKLSQQQSRYENQLMQQQDKFNVFAEQNKEYMQQLNQKSIDDQQRYNEQLNLLQQQQYQQQQQWQQSQNTVSTWQNTPTNTAPPTMPTIQGTVTSSQAVATLRTGTFKSSNDAYTLLGRLQNDYGASDAKVVNENGLFRVVGNFSDAARANTVGSRIQQLGYVQNYYTS
ncbi:SPOR domain-containing protein [Lysinibacillus sp. NPDC047702]|uniref:SPOR domain-containing protein n=1 Tax=unclassified Lysinibacillus TaxID=2636778 RepID=UPI003D05C90D